MEKKAYRVELGASKQLRLVLLLISLVLFAKTAVDIFTGYHNILVGNAPTVQVKDYVFLVGGVNLFGIFAEMLACNSSVSGHL
jgi:hypothetical protein